MYASGILLTALLLKQKSTRNVAALMQLFATYNTV